jgi:hypothetical protein
VLQARLVQGGSLTLIRYRRPQAKRQWVLTRFARQAGSRPGPVCRVRGLARYCWVRCGRWGHCSERPGAGEWVSGLTRAGREGCATASFSTLTEPRSRGRRDWGGLRGLRYLGGHGLGDCLGGHGDDTTERAANGGAVLDWGICGNSRHTRYMRHHLRSCAIRGTDGVRLRQRRRLRGPMRRLERIGDGDSYRPERSRRPRPSHKMKQLHNVR